MAGDSDRRAVLRLALAAALAPMIAAGARAAPLVPRAGLRFSPAPVPMTFSRRLVRSLPDGSAVTVERRFAVRFASAEPGWRVTGEQVGVAVDFPQRIAALAALERQRKDTGMFPLQLDLEGRIVGLPDAQPTAELDQAVALVGRALAKIEASPHDRAELDAFIRAVHDAGARMATTPPGDLFAPAAEPSKAERELTLPDGEQGTILVTFTAVADPASGLMRQARREIVTTIADDSRVTSEDWTLIVA